MKIKIATTLLISSVLLSSCQISNDDIYISKWMFSDDLTPYQCENTLGKAEKEEMESYTKYFWNNYNICNKYKGTLSLGYSDKGDQFSLNQNRNTYCFHWNLQCDNKKYNHIVNDLKNSSYIQKYIPFEPISKKQTKENFEKKNGKRFTFVTKFKDENYNYKLSDSYEKTEYFTITSIYKNGVLELQWGLGRVPIKE